MMKTESVVPYVSQQIKTGGFVTLAHMMNHSAA
jgi:hypothetical protein